MRKVAFLALAVSLGAGMVAEADGMLDPSFGKGGLVTTNFSQNGIEDAFSLAVLPDGRAVAVGAHAPNLAFTYMAAARYLVSGALDTTFGNGGLVNVGFEVPPGEFGQMDAVAYVVLRQADGRLVLVGGVAFLVSPFRFALTRLNLDGSLDPSFGPDGRVTTVFASPAIASSGLLQPDGRIVAVGTLGLSDLHGSLDTTFGSGGLATVDSGDPDRAEQVIQLPNGKLQVAGWTDLSGPKNPKNDFLLARFHPDGLLDTSFGTGGLLRTDFNGSQDQRNAVAIAGPDLLLTVGSSLSPASAQDFALARYIASTPVELLGFEVE